MMKKFILFTNVLLITNFNFLANINGMEEHHPSLEAASEHHAGHHTGVVSGGENEERAHSENLEEKTKKHFKKEKEKHPKKHQKQEHTHHPLEHNHHNHQK